MKKIFLTIIAILAFFLSSCDLDTFPDDKVIDRDIDELEEISTNLTDGTYAIFKANLTHLGSSYSGSTYVRHFFQMAEFPSDNITLTGRTSDPLYEATTYKRSSSARNVQYLWYAMYQVISGSNFVIESISDEATDQGLHLKGENLFMRAIAHLHLSQIWSRPYSHGRDNPGVVLVTSFAPTPVVRSTVGEVYDQIVADLEEAVRLMDKGEKRGEANNKGYISKATAQGLLSRVHLYREENEKAIQVVTEMLEGADPIAKLTPTGTFSSYFANAVTSEETLWAIEHISSDSKGSSSLASMYINANGVGWGEIYASNPLLELYDRYPQDERSKFIEPQYDQKNLDQYEVNWAAKGVEDGYDSQAENVELDGATNKYYFTKDGSKIFVETETVNTYPQTYIMLDGAKHQVRVRKKMEVRNTFPKYYVNKFSYQGGDGMLSSPVMLRWAEVILNRAEAYAKLGQNDKALADVNTIRERAGLSGSALFSSSNMHGYATAFDAVMDERRMELAFEGHRAHDVYRNKLSLDRKYPGVHTWESIDYKDNRTVYLISSNEISISHITQNP